MFIIVEGLDRSGKSTLANLIAQAFGFKVVHCSKPKTNDPYNEYLQLFKEYDGQDVVFDRFYLGEYVYSNLYRGGCPISDFQFWTMDMLAQKNNSILIYASTDAKTIYKRCVETNEPLSEFNYKQDIERTIALFDEIMNQTFLRPLHYNSAKVTPSQYLSALTPLVKSYLYFNNIDRKLDVIGSRSVGSRMASIMLIGEQLRPQAKPNEYPFFSGSSSDYLFKALRKSKLNKRDIYLTNALKPWLTTPELQRDVLELEISFVRPELIVCLGQISMNFLKEHKIGSDVAKIAIPHPSYWKRFNFSKLDEYVGMINKSAKLSEL